MGQCIRKVQYTPSKTRCGNMRAIHIRFERTVFRGDIAYQYEVTCNMKGILSWTTCLTVDQLSMFYSDILQKSYIGEDGSDGIIPNQYGKIMRPTTFTQCLQRVIDLSLSANCPANDPSIDQRIADLLSIPCELQSLIREIRLNS